MKDTSLVSESRIVLKRADVKDTSLVSESCIVLKRADEGHFAGF
jgi:hypothetical protein